MKILIDGYNLIFAWGWMPANDSPQASLIARKRLIEKLKQQIPSLVRRQFTVVFDVHASTSIQTRRSLASGVDPSGFHVTFALDHPDADALIEDLIRQESAPDRLIVVSTDRRLRTAAERRKATSIRSEDFLDAIENIVQQIDPGDSHLKDSGIADSSKQQAIEGLKDVDWLAEFGIDQADFDERPSTGNPNPKSIKEQLDDLIDP